MDGGTDYASNYFDNGEGYEDGDDDNLDEGGIYQSTLKIKNKFFRGLTPSFTGLKSIWDGNLILKRE